jgi:hypothetical protein
MPGFVKSPLAFDDCRIILDRALEAKNGIQVRCGSRGEAATLRSRLNSLRRVDRVDNKKIYQPDDNLYGNSEYDRLVIRLGKKGESDEHVVFIEVRKYKQWDVRENPEPKPEPPPDVDQLMRDLTGQDKPEGPEKPE